MASSNNGHFEEPGFQGPSGRPDPEFLRQGQQHRRRQHERQVIVLDDDRCQQLLENVLANRELQRKARQIAYLRAHIELLAAERANGIPADPGRAFASGDFSDSMVVDYNDDDEEFPPEVVQNLAVSANNDRRSAFEQDNFAVGTLPTLNRSLSQCIIEWVGADEELARQIRLGSSLAKEIAVGNVAGYLTGTLVKKFGKPVVCSLLGGMLLIRIAQSKGYVDINWGNVYNEVEHKVSSTNLTEGHEDYDDDEDFSVSVEDFLESQAEAERRAMEKQQEWLLKKIGSVRQFAQDNTYLAFGFVVGLLFKTLTD